MAFVTPQFSRNQVNRAGDILKAPDGYVDNDRAWAAGVFANWRASHAYPINTFQATLRKKLEGIDANAIVAQRLKRAPSILLKLRRFEQMQLARMQDIGGLRAVVASPVRVRKLEHAYRTASFAHVLASSKDYIAEPKDDGYRGVHLIYRYGNKRAPDYDGLLLELQIRTRLQHAWSTAVETMGTFLGQALKAGQGEPEWRHFFAAASAALAHLEGTPSVPGYEGHKAKQVFRLVAKEEARLHVLRKLRTFAIAADRITTERGRGAYHLIVLDSESRSVSITPYAMTRLEDANRDYAEVEMRTRAGEAIEAVLVSAGPVDALRKAYPNYFLDTAAFVKAIGRVIAAAK